jgi:hypothetical protein
MDRGGDELIGWSIDGVAAGLLGASVGACLLLLGLSGMAVVAGPAAGMIALAGLRQVRPEPRRFRVRAFALGPAGEDSPDVLDLTDEVTDSRGGSRLSDMLLTTPKPVLPPSVADVLDLSEVAAPEPLELEDRLPEPTEDSRVVQLFAARPLPTPGELAKRIEAHLSHGADESRGGKILELEVDAAAALRQALGELRRSLA